MMLASRPIALRACSGARRGVISRPKPFAGARRAVSAQAAQDAAQAPAAEEMAELLDDDLDIESMFNEIVNAEDDGEEVDGFEGDELAAALEAAELLSKEGLDAQTVAAISAELEEDDAEQTYAALYAEKLLADKMEDGSITAAELTELTAGLEATELQTVTLEDGVLAQSSDRFQEVPASAADKDVIAEFKLSKPELRNLLPEDWDQINIDFFSNKKDENVPLPEYRLNVLWTDKNLAVAIDQVYSRGQVSPLTEYYFWPRQDAWDDLRMSLEGQPWISERDRIILLNRLTTLINFWQDEEVKHSVDEARMEFPDCAFALA